MSLADIKTKIEADARNEAEGILGQFRAQADEILVTAKRESEMLDKKLQERINHEEGEVRKRKTIVADLEVRKLMLGAKRELVDLVYEKAMAILSSLPRDRYAGFMTALLGSSEVSGDEEVFLCKGEKVLDQKWLDEVNAQRQYNLTLSQDRVQGSGGFVLRKGRIDINCTWEVLLGRVKEDLEAEVVDRLFPSR
ncbi:MAG TPA: V-type ATP synthase subunit E family protein [Synergistales bacterium]|jgi:V/A-type H+-transporting ATPase subunit E|nr:V-type ATP synthase subunit E family protein [Synergistales bacterium]HOR54243.1 V-type ATP synthase subunit E family protein [Synergistales bacterium]HPK42520.1 V-type ATP synthase subunit E family protein [Synergistales bacterium]